MMSTVHKIQSETDLGQLIRQRRIELAMTQETLSSLSGIAQANLSKIERGEADARLGTYLKICFLLGLNLQAALRS